MDDETSSQTKRIWTYGMVLVSIVAIAVVALGLLLPRSEPELTTAPTTSSEAADPAVPYQPDIVDEPIDLNAPIPGCDVVEPPGELTSTASISSSDPSYDNPKFPWFSGPKATAMSNAVAELLPSGAEVAFASPEQSLVFQPITDYSESTPDPPNGSTYANGSVTNGKAKGGLYVTAQQTTVPVPACVAGSVDERRTLPDGVVVDVQDTWTEVDGVRTLSRSARSYVPDGSWISAGANDASGPTRDENSGTVPLSIEELVRIVTDPRLRVSTPVPPGTPAPSDGCRRSFDASGPNITRAQAHKLDAVLATVDLGGAKLNPLQLARHSENELCAGTPDATPTAGLDISIMGGQSLPVEKRPEPGSGNEDTFRRLGDGTVVQTSQRYNSSSSTGDPSQATRETVRSVVVTRPGGTQVSVSSSAPTPNETLSPEKLESIALTPGLEL